MRILVTGGSGFIGSALIRHLLAQPDHEVLNYDALTYAATLASLESLAGNARYRFVHADILDEARLGHAIGEFQPDVITHLAAESHVDRSIDDPAAFVRTNLVGTFTLLACALAFWRALPPARRHSFRFHHVSTDEVFGSPGTTGLSTETTPYDPHSPYSATKAGADHLVRAWGHTYGLPVIVTNCANNYGPYQFPEKLIPLMIVKALAGESLPVYGRGEQIRDWLFVEDHVRALQIVFERGRIGQTYNIGGRCERRNLDVVEALCRILDALHPRADGQAYRRQIRFVADRPGHDVRYAVDGRKLQDELGWSPQQTFEDGLRRTVQWYLDHRGWWQAILARGPVDVRRGLAI